MRARLVTVVTAALLLSCASAALADPTPEYFNVPAGYQVGAGISVGPDGTVWFSATPDGQSVMRPNSGIGRLIPSQASPGTANGVTGFLTPDVSGSGCCANFVRSVAVDPVRNRVWFVQSNGIVGWADPAAVSANTTNGMAARLLPNVGELWDVAVDPSSNLAWFTEYGSRNLAPFEGNRIASIDSGLAVSELPNIAAPGLPGDRSRLGVEPAGIALDRDGRPWFSEQEVTFNGWRIATVTNGAYEEFEVKPCAAGSPCSGSNTGTGITDVALAQDGSVWFTNQLRNEVGRFDYATRTFTSYSLTAIDATLANGQARRITAAPDGSLWVAEYGGFSNANANAIVKIVPTQPSPTATVYHLGAGKFPLAVAPDNNGNVWFAVTTAVAPTLIGRLANVTTPAGGGSGGTGGSGGGTGGGRRITAVSVARAGPPQVHGTAIAVDQMCVGPPQDPCSLVFIISAHEYVTGFPGSRNAGRASAAAAAVASAAAKRRAHGRRRRAVRRPLILGTKTVTMHGGERRRITISLNRTGKRLLARSRSDKLTVFFTVTQRRADGRPRRIKAVKVTFKVSRARARRR